MSDDDNSPISARAAKQLFAGLRSAPALLLAVSGGPDSVALMWLAARWQRGLARGPQLTVATVDHGLRPEAAREAREVKRLAAELGLAHRTLRWRGAKPKTGLPHGRTRSPLPPACASRAQRRREPCADRPHPRRSGRDPANAPCPRQRTCRAVGDGAPHGARRHRAGAPAARCPEVAADRDPEAGEDRLCR